MDQAHERAIQWECKHLLASYYNYVDHGEFEAGAHIFAPDVEWRWREWSVSGRENMLNDLKSALTTVQIRHLITNTVVKVIDEDHAESLSYVTIYTHKGDLAEETDRRHTRARTTSTSYMTSWYDLMTAGTSPSATSRPPSSARPNSLQLTVLLPIRKPESRIEVSWSMSRTAGEGR